MRHAAFVLALTLAGTFTLAAQDKKKTKDGDKIISLSGCVVRNEKMADQFTIKDAGEGIYRLTGVKVRDYLGQRVEIAGAVVETKRLTIKGGLSPNANVAAQAGAMDPARAAMAAAGGAAGPGSVDLPEFKVKNVRPVIGGCPN